jgi:NAD-dependent DNA ligase
MKIYHLKLEKPRWFYDPATNRQLKLIKFFDGNAPEGISKGVASGIIGRIFSNAENKELWEKYLYVTGDELGDTSELEAYDINELKNAVIPDDWKPKKYSQSGIDAAKHKRLQEIVSNELKEGSPFDDPVPEIKFKNKSFCFTGIFSSATRSECLSETEKAGAIPHKAMKNSTNFLVIGIDDSKGWVHGKYGRKIEKAMILRMELGNPIILSEADWLTAMQNQEKETTDNE